MKSIDTSHGRRRKTRGSMPNLRPPTLMIDLLFGALMLFAFQMGDPNSKSVIPHGIELPTDETQDTKKTTEILPLQPVSIRGGEWIYETNEGERLTADEVAGRTKSGKITELAVRDVIHGQPVRNTEALANPGALDHFRNLIELRS